MLTALKIARQSSTLLQLLLLQYHLLFLEAVVVHSGTCDHTVIAECSCVLLWSCFLLNLMFVLYDFSFFILHQPLGVPVLLSTCCLLVWLYTHWVISDDLLSLTQTCTVGTAHYDLVRTATAATCTDRHTDMRIHKHVSVDYIVEGTLHLYSFSFSLFQPCFYCFFPQSCEASYIVLPVFVFCLFHLK